MQYCFCGIVFRRPHVTSSPCRSTADRAIADTSPDFISTTYYLARVSDGVVTTTSSSGDRATASPSSSAPPTEAVSHCRFRRRSPGDAPGRRGQRQQATSRGIERARGHEVLVGILSMASTGSVRELQRQPSFIRRYERARCSLHAALLPQSFNLRWIRCRCISAVSNFQYLPRSRSKDYRLHDRFRDLLSH